MKKFVLFISVAGVLFTSICFSGERSMTTPADRLVGHWSDGSGSSVYFGKIKQDGIGSYIIVQPDGNTGLHQYKIISQIPTGERVIIQLHGSDDSKRSETYTIQKDGNKLDKTTEIFGVTLTTPLEYVDTKEKP